MTTVSDSDDQESVVTSWCSLFKQGTDFDTWGQPLEATEMYQSLSKQLHHCSMSDNGIFTDKQKKFLEKIRVCLDSRSKFLQDRVSKEGISLEDLLKLESTLKNLCLKPSENFPVDVRAAQLQTRKYPNSVHSLHTSNDEDKPSQRVSGNLLPKPLPVANMRYLSVRVEKMGLKDASQFIDPFICVSVKDVKGHNLTAIQNTPIASDKQDTCVFFNVDVHIQKTIESLPPGFAVFFEFKHFKPKKKSTSTKCWAFLEQDEIKEGPTYLELYKKPTDPCRKKVHLLTVKPLYLHLKLSLDS
ncbi:axin interactor, dorsalization-associated protein-like [Haliotis asinina]|uniref:axin interactor, dorsalization-associated protein-like n=1 Tax=Haliotis asinina TaxID=109174 RepID=UPI003531EDF4